MNPILSKRLVKQYLQQEKYYDVDIIKNFTVKGHLVRVNFSTFERSYSFNLSLKKLNSFYLSRMVEKSKAVDPIAKFLPIGTVIFKSDSDPCACHVATFIACDCKDFANNQTPDLIGVRICKHTIATARELGLNSIGDLRQAIEHRSKIAS